MRPVKPLVCLAGQIAPHESADSYFARVTAQMAAPGFGACPADAVRVGDFEGLCGVSPKMLVVSGFADGLVPPHAYFDGTELTNEQHDKLHAKLVRQLCAALGKARETLLVTCFDEIEGDSAAMLKLRIRRIRLKDGNRVCQVGPSVFLDRLAC